MLRCMLSSMSSLCSVLCVLYVLFYVFFMFCSMCLQKCVRIVAKMWAFRNTFNKVVIQAQIASGQGSHWIKGKGKKTCSYITRCSKCFTHHPLAELFNSTPFRLWEVFSHAAITGRRLFVHISIYVCSQVFMCAAE